MELVVFRQQRLADCTGDIGLTIICWSNRGNYWQCVFLLCGVCVCVFVFVFAFVFVFVCGPRVLVLPLLFLSIYESLCVSTQRDEMNVGI